MNFENCTINNNKRDGLKKNFVQSIELQYKIIKSNLVIIFAFIHLTSLQVLKYYVDLAHYVFL